MQTLHPNSLRGDFIGMKNHPILDAVLDRKTNSVGVGDTPEAAPLLAEPERRKVQLQPNVSSEVRRLQAASEGARHGR